MSRVAQRFAVAPALAVAFAALLSGCFGSGVGTATEGVATELEQLPGVESALAVTAEPGLDNPGVSSIRLDLAAGIVAGELEDVVRRWAELAPRVPLASHLIATLPEGDRLEVRANVATDAAVQESATWLALADTHEVALTVFVVDGETSSDWGVRLSVGPGEFGSAVAALRTELTERGRTWGLTSATVDGLEISLSSTAGFPPDAVLDALGDVASTSATGMGPTSIEGSWYVGAGDRLSIRITVEPTELRDVPSNELLDNVAGTPVEALAADLRDGVTPPSIATRIALHVFSSAEYLVIDNAMCAGQSGCAWTVGEEAG